MYHAKIIRCFLLCCMVVGSVNLGGCVAARNLNVLEADENMVKNCTFLGTFSSSYYEASGALTFAVNQAAEKGATHYVLWGDNTTKHHAGELATQTRVTLRGYKCSENKSNSINQQEASNASRVKKTEQKKKVTNKSRTIATDDRFIAYENGTVQDKRTNLMWAAKDNGSDIKWSAAKEYCENYRGGGNTDWRMPTQDELATLYDANKSTPIPRYPKKNMHVATKFIDITAEFCWSNVSGKNFNFIKGEKENFAGFMSLIQRALPVR